VYLPEGRRMMNKLYMVDNWAMSREKELGAHSVRRDIDTSAAIAGTTWPNSASPK
jgi:hypothetical protein